MLLNEKGEKIMSAISFNVDLDMREEQGYLAIAVDKIVSVFDVWSEEKQLWITTVDLVNGLSYEISHNHEDIGEYISNAIHNGDIKNTIFEHMPAHVNDIKKIKTK